MRADRLAASAAILAVAAAASGCDRFSTRNTAFNNSGASVSGQLAPASERALDGASNPPPPNIVAREIPATSADATVAPSPQPGAR